ncbi:MAG: hypothetical protein OXH31_01025 [Gammaproteobacteria bacterium]|nr:hypothetical protein [Gammaproteobacteria bacterium]
MKSPLLFYGLERNSTRRRLWLFQQSASNYIGFLSGILLCLFLCSCERGDQSVAEIEEGQVEFDETRTVRTEDIVGTNGLGEGLLLTGDFRELDRFPNRFVRNLALHQRLIQSNENELFEILANTSNISRQSIRDDVQHLIVHRLATLNPKETLGQIENLQIANQGTLVALIFGEWAIKNLDDAVNHAKTLETRKKFLALRGILRSRDDLSDSQHRSIAAQLGVKHLTNDLLSRSDDNEIIESPDLKWLELASDAQMDLAQIDRLTRIAENWIERDGLDVIEDIYESITDWQIRMPVLSTALHKATLRDPQTTFDHVSQLDFDQGHFLVTSVVKSWANVDPNGALDAVVSVESVALRTQLQDSIVRTWASTDPNGLLTSLNLLPTNMRMSGVEHAVVAMSRNDPANASLIFVDQYTGNNKVSIARSLVLNWSAQDAQTAVDWVLSSPHVAELQNELLPFALGELVTSDPNKAIEIALAQPIESDQWGMEASVLGSLALSDPQQATEMLSRVREGPTKVRAYSLVGTQLIRNGDVDQALTLVDDLSDEEQIGYFETIIDTWALTHPVHLLDRIDKLPNEDIKARAAAGLIAFQQYRKALTADQINAAREFLSEEGASLSD